MYSKIIIKDYNKPNEFQDPKQHPLMPIHPFRLVINGASKSGKTNLLVNLIYDYLNFDRLYICAKDIFESKYEELRENYTQFEDIELEDIKKCKGLKNKKEIIKEYKKYKKDEVIFTSCLEEFITVDDLDPSYINLVVFDDCIVEKDQHKIEEFFIRGRKKNASIIYLSQYYYKIPITIRSNSDYFIFFNMKQREIDQIIREIDGQLTRDEFREMFKNCIRKRYDFFMLDLVNPEMRYRCKFQPI